MLKLVRKNIKLFVRRQILTKWMGCTPHRFVQKRVAILHKTVDSQMVPYKSLIVVLIFLWCGAGNLGFCAGSGRDSAQLDSLPEC